MRVASDLKLSSTDQNCDVLTVVSDVHITECPYFVPAGGIQGRAYHRAASVSISIRSHKCNVMIIVIRVPFVGRFGSSSIPKLVQDLTTFLKVRAQPFFSDFVLRRSISRL